MKAPTPATVLMMFGFSSLAGFLALAIWGYYAFSSESITDNAARAEYWGGLIGTGASVASVFFVVAALLLQQKEIAEQRRAQQEASASFDLQLKAARHTEVTQSLVTLIQTRAKMVQDLDSAKVTREREPLFRSLKAIDPLVDQLLKDPVLTPEEGAAFRAARDAMVSPRELPE